MLTDKNRVGLVNQIATAGILIGVLGVTYLILLSVNLAVRLLREQGIHMVSRILGLSLCALAVETTLTGFKEFWKDAAR